MWGATEHTQLDTRETLQFQSTRPVWGATTAPGLYWDNWEFQSTRPVWGATEEMPAVEEMFEISIHAPRVGRDQFWGWGF